MALQIVKWTSHKDDKTAWSINCEQIFQQVKAVDLLRHQLSLDFSYFLPLLVPRRLLNYSCFFFVCTVLRVFIYFYDFHILLNAIIKRDNGHLMRTIFNDSRSINMYRQLIWKQKYHLWVLRHSTLIGICKCASDKFSYFFGGTNVNWILILWQFFLLVYCI